MKRVGRRYRAKRTEGPYDAIVIGSGIGGLACAALLSKLGQRVCVLEQHYTAGGFTHSYEREGYEWDVGVHYIGEVHKPHSPLRRIFDVISDGQLQWASMGDAYDRIIIGDREYDFRANKANFIADMSARFPDEADAIQAYVDLVYRISRSMQPFFAGQAMPKGAGWLARMVRDLRAPKECLMTVREVLEDLTQNQELIGVLTGQWGDYGMPPAKATFLMHAAVAKHYFAGGNYPVGGSWRIADTIVPVIRAGGGEVFTYAAVEEILIENGRAVGVRMDDDHEIRAKRVISNAGARNTYGRLLPESERTKHGLASKLDTVKPSSAHLCLYVGLDGTAEELGIEKTNLWVYPSPHHEQNVEAFLEDPEQDFPLVYISFPSAKDPQWNSNYPGKSTVEVLTLGPHEWFAQWQDQTWNDRGEDYEAKKAAFSERMLEVLYKHCPQLRGKVAYHELSTPLSTQWFQFNDLGEIYGLDHDPDRFKQPWLHPQSPVKGLYLTGQDVVTAGVGGALMGGVMTTAAIMGLKQQKVWKLLKTWEPPEGYQAVYGEPVLAT